MATYYSTVPTDPAKTARAYGRDLDCSPKSGRNVARAIKGMPVGRAKEFLESVTNLETPVPFKVRNRKIHHRRGEGFGPGKWPVGVTTRFLKVLESAEANAEYKGLDKERLVVTHASAYQGTVTQAYTPRAMGRATPHYNRLCNFEVIVTQVEGEDGAASGADKGSKPKPKAKSTAAKKGAAKRASAKKTKKKKEG